jgi:hypothetical protein
MESLHGVEKNSFRKEALQAAMEEKVEPSHSKQILRLFP